MYSSSSSECECDEYCTCEAGYGNQNQSVYGRSPFYATMGHPLIYYAQVPPFKKQRSRESRKDNQNCFAKAFKWYTQEHVSHQSSPNKMEMNAFAVWLDSKYNEFLQDSQLNNVYHLKMKQTSTIEADIIPNNACCEPRSKRFRVKSPWKKKPRLNTKEAGDTNHKQNQSFHFILKPKEIVRVASEVQPSNATMVSNEIPMKSTLRSQSYTLVSYDLDVTKSFDGNKLSKTGELNKAAVDENVSQVGPNPNEALQNISCQCSVLKVEKTNTHTQYDSSDAKRCCETTCGNQIQPRTIISCSSQPCHNTSATPNNVPKVAVTKNVQANVLETKNTTLCQCPKELNSKADSQSQHQTYHVECKTSLSNIRSTSKIVKTCPCEIEEVFNVENPIILSNPITFSSDGAQTSDHSIHLGKATSHGYPLFMKIICADKLCK